MSRRQQRALLAEVDRLTERLQAVEADLSESERVAGVRLERLFQLLDETYPRSERANGEPLYDLTTRSWSKTCPCIRAEQRDPECPYHGRALGEA